MNIRKWVDFVLNPHLKQEQRLEGMSIHSVSCDPKYLSEDFMEHPRQTEARILSILQETSDLYESVRIDTFSNPVAINIFKKSAGHEVVDGASPIEISALLGEAQYSRMRQYGIYKFGCLIEYETTFGDDKRGLDDIVSDIRAIPTVTIVSVVLANEKVSTGRYVAGLQIKFIPSFPGNLTQPEEAKAYILRMTKKIKNVKGISRVTLKTDRIE